MEILGVKHQKLFPTLKHVLERGGVAVIPTDTVYGLLSRADLASLNKLAKLKGKKDLKFAVFFDSTKTLSKYARLTSKTQKRSLDLLPGRLTLLFHPRGSYDFVYGGKIGARVPKLDWLLQFLREFGEPLAATSANLHDEPVLRNLKELKRTFTGVDLIVNAGELDNRPSTVLDLTTYPPVIRRLGSASIYEIEPVLKRKVKIDPNSYFSILIVCTGNSCRSPMAVGYLKEKLKGMPVFVYSAGTIADLGLPAAENAITVMREMGIDISHHQSQPLSRELIIRSDLILVMQPHHRERVLELDPDAGPRTFLLRDFPKGGGIFDPIGGTVEVYRRCLQLMIPGLDRVAEEIRRRY
ncbi:hypothetical protein DRP53_04835 [candidate division WOR-3 bacterium]|uniref:L-threonylcarbamoyladenylate synthase n=1 Tax=candidate division WOR-3 bacterium TaxID=2052148 RepID=A0A660SK43_UNCW3|nr:MAG: hypothetical protein DRP53_04835 [candidate division WOR-3 bacterium]